MTTAGSRRPWSRKRTRTRQRLASGWLSASTATCSRKAGWRLGRACIDPFGGIGGCAFHAALYGMHWTGVELEPKFVALAQQNLDLWRARYAPHFPGYGTARILQGDSRNLAALVGTADASVSSPPYAESNIAECTIILASGMTRGARSPVRTNRQNGCSDRLRTPPRPARRAPRGGLRRRSQQPAVCETLERLEPATQRAQTGKSENRHTANSSVRSGHMTENLCAAWPTSYGDITGQLRQRCNPDTFWAAAREIVAQTFAVLRPGGVAAWICGDFVRNKQRVPFGEQWLALCESVGFEPLAWAVAWKQTDHGAQLDIFGEAIPQQTTRVSFFRRLANAKNPAAAILNEDVIFVRKPAGTGSGFDGSVSSPPFKERLLQQGSRTQRTHDPENPKLAADLSKRH